MRDFDIRRALLQRLSSEHDGEPDTLIIEELGLCQGESRADIAVINGSIQGYEIKSERDTLERLPKQRLFYEQCFDAVTLVLSERHLKSALGMIPEGWGLLLARQQGDAIELRSSRPPEPNTGVVAGSVVQLLWRDEVVTILSHLGQVKGLRRKSRRELWEMLASALPPVELHRTIREAIKARGDWRAEMRQARSNGSSPTVSTAEHRQANLEWLLSQQSPHLPD